MKILRELLAEIKRSNDLKEKELDFKIMSDVEFGQKYDCSVPLGRRQEHFSTSNEFTHTNSGRWY